MEKKVVLITGASRGIGAAIAEKFASEKYNVVITYNGNKEKADNIANELNEKYNTEVTAYKTNIANEEDLDTLVTAIKDQYGKIDVLVNNAGITNDMLAMRMKKADFTDVIDVNLTGTFLLTQKVLKLMSRKKTGSVVNMASVVGITGNFGQANYSASKAAVIALTKTLSKEYGKRNIRVNAIAPGFIATDMTDSLSEEIKDGVMRNISMERFGQVEEIAEAVYFIGSEKSSYITGQTLVIDGGMI